MVDVLRTLTLILVALAMVPAVAHALELPGKLRLSKDGYFAVQPIYYPGFTIAGTSEPLAIVAVAILIVVTPRTGFRFWLTIASLIGLLMMQAVYWLRTHPINRVWLQGKTLGRAGSNFFGVAARPDRDHDDAARNAPEWTALRDQWEYSHVARAGLAAVSFVALTIAVSGGG